MQLWQWKEIWTGRQDTQVLLDRMSGHPGFMAYLFQLISYVSLDSRFLVCKMRELEKAVGSMSFLSTSAAVQLSVLLPICQHNLVFPGT